MPHSRLATLAHITLLLHLTWAGYKGDFIQGDGRVIDHGRAAVSTSEGESYALLRAVWIDDHRTFDRVWRWTRDNLQVRGDKLFGYLWGRHSNGRWSILSADSATDADEDIALALIFAARRWHESVYLRQARAIVRDIWAHEVARVRGKPYLAAGNWALSRIAGVIAINPSYFAPYAYRIFARVDAAHPWMQLVDTSYRVLSACSTSPLGENGSVDLPPNWCAIGRTTGSVAPLRQIDMADEYGYDAFRVMWRIGLDYQWNREPRAKAYLERSSFLRRQWRQQAALFAEYQHNGTPLTTREDPVLYGGDIGNFLVTDLPAARSIAVQKLLAVFTQRDGVAYWDQRYAYYEQNWVWFGLALLVHQLPDLMPVTAPTPTLSR